MNGFEFDLLLDQVLSAFIYLAGCFVLFLLGRVIYQFFHRSFSINEELVEKDNFAFSLAHAGYLIGLLLSIGGALVGPSYGWLKDLEFLFIYGGVSILLLNISIILNDKIILNKFKVRKEIIEDRNEGTGVIEAANAIATGLIIMGCVTGEDGNIFTVLIFWVVGQIVLFLAAKVYNLILPYDIHDHIEKDNVAVGIGFAGALIAIGNIIRFAIYGNMESWEAAAINLVVYVIVGLLFLPIVRFLTDKLLLPGQNLTDEIVNQDKPNHGAALIEAFAYIGGSVLISWVL